VSYAANHHQDSTLPRPHAVPRRQPSAEASFVVYDWGLLLQKIKGETISISLQTIRSRIVLNTKLAEAGNGYINSWAARKRLETAKSAVDCVREIKNQIEASAKPPSGTGSAMRSVDVDLAAVTVEYNQALATLNRAIAASRKFAPSGVNPPKDIFIPIAIMSLEDAPDAVAAKIEVQLAENDGVIAGYSGNPTLEAFGTLEHTTGETYSDFTTGLFDGQGRSVRVKMAAKAAEAAKARHAEIMSDNRAKINIARSSLISSGIIEGSTVRFLAAERIKKTDAINQYKSGKAEAGSITAACRKIASAEYMLIGAKEVAMLAKFSILVTNGELP
jgi:copper chaperone CopZ